MHSKRNMVKAPFVLIPCFIISLWQNKKEFCFPGFINCHTLVKVCRLAQKTAVEFFSCRYVFYDDHYMIDKIDFLG